MGQGPKMDNGSLRRYPWTRFHNINITVLRSCSSDLTGLRNYRVWLVGRQSTRVRALKHKQNTERLKQSNTSRWFPNNSLPRWGRAHAAQPTVIPQGTAPCARESFARLCQASTTLHFRPPLLPTPLRGELVYSFSVLMLLSVIHE